MITWKQGAARYTEPPLNGYIGEIRAFKVTRIVFSRNDNELPYLSETLLPGFKYPNNRHKTEEEGKENCEKRLSQWMEKAGLKQ